MAERAAAEAAEAEARVAAEAAARVDRAVKKEAVAAYRWVGGWVGEWGWGRIDYALALARSLACEVMSVPATMWLRLRLQSPVPVPLFETSLQTPPPPPPHSTQGRVGAAAGGGGGAHRGGTARH